MTVEQDTARRTIRVRGQAFVDKVKELIHEGNVRRLVIKNEQGHTVMEIPVTAGVVAAVVAPVVTAIGAIAALANEWSIEVEHTEPPAGIVEQDAEPIAGSPRTSISAWPMCPVWTVRCAIILW